MIIRHRTPSGDNRDVDCGLSSAISHRTATEAAGGAACAAAAAASHQGHPLEQRGRQGPLPCTATATASGGTMNFPLATERVA